MEGTEGVAGPPAQLVVLYLRKGCWNQGSSLTRGDASVLDSLRSAGGEEGRGSQASGGEDAAGVKTVSLEQTLC